MEDEEEPQPLRSFIGKLLNEYRLQASYNEARVRDAWEKVMGSYVLKRTTNLFLKEGVLFIELDSASLRNEVLMARSELQNELNQRIGAEIVKEIRVI